MNTVAKINDELALIGNLLRAKNTLYGNSALEPINIFSKQSPTEGIKLRIDDKLKRIKNLSPNDTEDTILDLIGYLILLRISMRSDEHGDAGK